MPLDGRSTRYWIYRQVGQRCLQATSQFDMCTINIIYTVQVSSSPKHVGSAIDS